jgi:hypothetical protein
MLMLAERINTPMAPAVANAATFWPIDALRKDLKVPRSS